MTTARYDYSADEKRILLRLVEIWQNLLESKKLQGKVEQTLFGDYILEFPLSHFLSEGSKNYERIKAAFRALNEKKFEYEDDEVWEIIRIIEKPQIKKREKVIFELNPKIVDCFLNFTKGYRKYELETAFSFSSVYAMRMYEFLSGQKEPFTRKIEVLKQMFQMQNKYKRDRDFIRFVIEPAKKELDEKSPYTFEYEINKSGRKFTSITFHPVAIPKNRDERLEKESLAKQISMSYVLDKVERQYFYDIGFTDRQIKNNFNTIIESKKLIPDFLFELSILKGKARDKKNPKGYIINALKGKIQDIKNRL
jgi:plasmid replication initiation protein